MGLIVEFWVIFKQPFDSSFLLTSFNVQRKSLNVVSHLGAIQIIRDILGEPGGGGRTICHTNFFTSRITLYNGFWE
jgi:hypothetical protein